MENRTIKEVKKVEIGFPIEYEDKNNIVRNGLFLREPEIKVLEKRLKEINRITDLKQQCKKQKEVIDKLEKKIKVLKQYDFDKVGRYELLDIFKEVSE